MLIASFWLCCSTLAGCGTDEPVAPKGKNKPPPAAQQEKADDDADDEAEAPEAEDQKDE